MTQLPTATTYITLPPFERTTQISNDNDVKALVAVQVPRSDRLTPEPTSKDVADYINQELGTPIIDECSPWLWLFARKQSDHIDAFHIHRMKRRTITISEDSKLHLVWHGDTVYVKPVPAYLLNRKFWETYLLPPGRRLTNSQPTSFDVGTLSKQTKSAFGFLRSYCFLVKHKSDFVIAQEANLLPKAMTYIQFRRFLLHFQYLPDDVVSPRYQYGQLRHTGLNWAVRLLRPPSKTSRWTYYQRHWQMTQFIVDAGAPLLAIFAVISLALSAMQVVLAAYPAQVEGWAPFRRASLWYSVAILISHLSVVAVTIFGVLGVLLGRLGYAVWHKPKK